MNSIDEHRDRKWGKKTAHVGRQWLANIGKTDVSDGHPSEAHRDSCFSSLGILRPGFFRSTAHLIRYHP